MSEKQKNNQEEKQKRPNKVNLESLSQTHGKIERFEPTTLDQVWGDKGTWKYSTMDENEYRVMVENMPKSDLAAHAQKIGLIPISDRTQLIKRLTVEFKRHVMAYRAPKVDGGKVKPISKEVQKILKEGR
jgi:hypothetical protein